MAYVNIAVQGQNRIPTENDRGNPIKPRGAGVVILAGYTMKKIRFAPIQRSNAINYTKWSIFPVNIPNTRENASVLTGFLWHKHHAYSCSTSSDAIGLTLNTVSQEITHTSLSSV